MIWNMFKKLKIGKKLFVSYLLACVIPLMITSMTIYRFSARNLEETSLELATVFGSQMVASLDTFIEEYNRATKIILVDNDIIYRLDEMADASITERVDQQLNMRKIMMRLAMLKPEIKNICYLTAGHQFYQYNSDGSSISKEILLEQDWMVDVLDSQEQMLITAAHDRSYCDREQGGIVITVGRRILDHRGAYVGVILMDIDPNNLIELSEGFLLTRNQYNIKISVTDARRNILYDSDVASGIITWEEAQNGGSFLVYEENQSEYILLQSETKKSELSVNVSIPRSDLLFKINKTGYVTAFAVIACVAVSLIIAFFVSKMITNPIARLQESMKQVQEGDYREMVQQVNDDEMGDLVTSYNRMVMRIKSLIEDVYMAEIKQKNARYLALKTQINPHMLYNTLESIRMKALVSGADEVADMIKILARMFKLSLSDSTASHKIKNEIEYAQHYMTLQNMRFPGAFSLKVELKEQIYEAYIISMILQPIIENSIEHGLKGLNQMLHITVSGMVTENDDICIRVSDDGKGIRDDQIQQINHLLNREISVGFNKEQQEEKGRKGIGLKNIAERIRLYYGEGYYLKVISNSGEGTVVELCIPGQWDETKRMIGEE